MKLDTAALIMYCMLLPVNPKPSAQQCRWQLSTCQNRYCLSAAGRQVVGSGGAALQHGSSDIRDAPLVRRSGLTMPWTTATRPSCRGQRCHPGTVARFLHPCASPQCAMPTAPSLEGAGFRTRCGSSWMRLCTPVGSWKQRRHGLRRCGLIPCRGACTMQLAEQQVYRRGTCLVSTIGSCKPCSLLFAVAYSELAVGFATLCGSFQVTLQSVATRSGYACSSLEVGWVWQSWQPASLGLAYGAVCTQTRRAP
jgi:hypothetical protein